MSNSRNNNWKKFVEGFLPAEVLMGNVADDVIGFGNDKYIINSF